MSPSHLEQTMSYLDGELTGDAAVVASVHLQSCTECQGFAGDLRAVSERLGAWQVGAAPEVPSPRARGRWFTRSNGLLAAAAGVILVTVIMFAVNRRTDPRDVIVVSGVDTMSRRTATAPLQADKLEYSPAATPGAAVQVTAASAGPLIVRTASLTLSVRDFEAARAALEEVATRMQGFIGDLTASGGRGDAPSLHATLRIPSARLAETMAALKRLGEVLEESQTSEDVTRQSVDLDARLANARISEARLKEILERRTGRLADVLDVEREVARVRGEIEQMEAERKNLDGRVSYANVAVMLSAQRKAEIGLGPGPVSARLRNAVVDGWVGAGERGLEFVLFAARILPTLILLTLVVLPVGLWARRRLNPPSP